MAESIQSFASRVNTHLDEVGKSVDGVVADITELKRLITVLQASQGQVTPEDQATIDAIELRIAGAAARVKALDEETAPAEVPVPA